MTFLICLSIFVGGCIVGFLGAIRMLVVMQEDLLGSFTKPPKGK